MVTKKIIIFLLFLFSSGSLAKSVVNVYAWADDIPEFIVTAFERETGISVNLSAYDNNETLYSKIKASPNAPYDVIQPTGYFVKRLMEQNLLLELDYQKIPNAKLIDPFLNRYPRYSVPFFWGVSGIVVNNAVHPQAKLKAYKDLWRRQYRNQLLILDDMREIFTIAYLVLGLDPNSADAKSLALGFDKIKALIPNVKVFSQDNIQSILINEDATLGVCWNGDAFQARRALGHIDFIYPKEGFLIWVDGFAIPKNAPHPDNAHRFINFIMRPDINARIAKAKGYATSHLGAQRLLPKVMRESEVLYPNKAVLERGHFMSHYSLESLKNISRKWQLLKLSSQ